MKWIATFFYRSPESYVNALRRVAEKTAAAG